MNPDVAVIHYNKAVEAERRGRYEDAVREYRVAIRLDPNDIDAQLRLGLLLRDLGRDEEANQAFQAALALKSARGPGLRRAGAWAPAWVELPVPEDSGTIGS